MIRPSATPFPVQPPGEKMDAHRIDRFGSIDGIVLRSSEDPRPGLREILMRVRASSLNYRDLMVLKGGGRSDLASAVGKRHNAELRRTAKLTRLAWWNRCERIREQG